MPPSVSINPRDSLRAQLALTIRCLRELRGLSQDQLAKELHSTRPTIQAYESGRNGPDEEFCKLLDRFFNTGELFQGLWFHAQREHLAEWLDLYVAHESSARQVRTFQSVNIPGLLQTEGYMRASSGGDAKDLDEKIAIRLGRRDILTREADPAEFFAVLDEAVIKRPIGGSTVVREQLQHLLAMSKLSNVTIQVVREQRGWHPGLDGPMVILNKPDGRAVGYIEAQFGGRLIEDPAEVARLGLRFDYIRVKALSDEASLALIRDTMESMCDDQLAEE